MLVAKIGLIIVCLIFAILWICLAVESFKTKQYPLLAGFIALTIMVVFIGISVVVSIINPSLQKYEFSSKDYKIEYEIQENSDTTYVIVRK